MFKSEGTFKVKILDAVVAQPKFAQPPAFDICLQVQDVNDASQTDWWRGEMSQNFGKGNFKDRTQMQITMENLQKIGFEGNDISTLKQQLVNKETTATTKASSPTADGKVFYNVRYLGDSGGNAPEVLDPAEMQARLQQLTGGNLTPPQQPQAAAGTQQAPQAPVTTGNAPNPFGGTSPF